jgi:hypothetical protein
LAFAKCKPIGSNETRIHLAIEPSQMYRHCIA